MNVKRFNQLLESTMGNVKPLLEGSIGDEPPELTPEATKEISSFLWDKISNDEYLKERLHIDDSHTEHNFLNDVSHMIHSHFDPKTGHMGFDIGGEKLKLNLGFSPFGGHGGEGGHDTHSTPSFSMPHSTFDFGVKIPLSSMLKKH